ncbi:BgTH12-01600 [Blumeria graminis f. sp. triticale]|uniref:BgTH12-01600 n=1 Tax=Blumeria graminis f. sp. triticale TaxID=1689686 RepID=A0A9W4CZ24_BLUGR|nr:BgTH12-01600 [Blumeria graminis f. sp. triticale]
MLICYPCSGVLDIDSQSESFQALPGDNGSCLSVKFACPQGTTYSSSYGARVGLTRSHKRPNSGVIGFSRSKSKEN